MIECGLDEFEKRFGSKGLIRYWLSPPCGQDTWFLVGSDFHNPISSNCCQYKDLPKYFGASAWWEADEGKFTKPLFEIETSALIAAEPAPNLKSEHTKAELIPLLFRNSIVLEGISPEEEIKLPVKPALPFLFAVKDALERARTENGETDDELKNKPLVLKRDSNRVLIALKQSRDASGLVTKVNNPSPCPEDDEVSGSIYRALRAKVIPPEDLKDKKGSAILKCGTAGPIAGVEWSDADKELRIYWPTK
jgi:hypothetical protein